MKNGEALYLQIYGKLLEEIKDGVYADNRPLPTEAEAAKQYLVSRITSKKALTKLAEEGVIVRIPGRGSFVKKDYALPVLDRVKDSQAKSIALVMGGYTSSFGMDVINGALARTEELGMHLILKNTGNDQKRESQMLKALIHSNVSGIIIQPAHGELYNEVILNAVYSKYPIVMADRFMPGIDVPFVGVDNVNLARQAVSRLISCGHRNISLLALEDDLSSSLKDRMQGYMEAFADHLLAVKKDLWLTRINDLAQFRELDYNEYTAHEAYVNIIAAHLQSHPEITAIFGTEYSMAKAAWDAARRIGKRIPEDISIVSFDFDSGYLGVHHLSHIRQPQRGIGSCAVEVIHAILQGKPPKNRCFLLDGEWIEGNTIAPPRGALGAEDIAG